MDPALVALIVRLAPIVLEGAQDAFKVKAVLSSDDQAAVDAAYAEYTAKRNAVADRLRATPDDPG